MEKKLQTFCFVFVSNLNKKNKKLKQTKNMNSSQISTWLKCVLNNQIFSLIYLNSEEMRSITTIIDVNIQWISIINRIHFPYAKSIHFVDLCNSTIY